ncbi:hypothetical protein CR513_48030, partial [Mucuna pruriens]
MLLTRKQDHTYLKKGTWCSRRYCQTPKIGEGNEHQTIKDPTGALILTNADGRDLKHLVNADLYDQEEVKKTNPGSV